MVQTNPINKYREKPTRVNAIKAKCAECMGVLPITWSPDSGKISAVARQLIARCIGGGHTREKPTVRNNREVEY